ncbi:MAG: hypothetical protein JXA53_03910, partial [Bacteroidales bacterium]|nr:hypothetical protein [Bacteroidales bacterium]
MTTSNSNKSSRIFIKVLFPVLFFVFGVHIQAQDLIFGQSDIINYDNAAEASVLKEDISKGIKIEQIGTQGVIGSPSYIQLNNSNTSPVLNNTSNDALTISCTSTDIDHVIVTYAANSGSTQPYVGYSNIISSMGSTSVNITSCIQADPVGVTQTEVTYACPNNTRFFLMVRNKACAPNTANSTTVRISNIQVFLKSPTCTTPTTQVGAVLFSGVRDTQMAVNLSSYGSGDHILLVAKSGSAVDANPIDGTSYTANASFGTGTEIGTGNYVVYSGPLSGLPITVTGLSPVTSYHFAAYAYNTCSGSPRYKTDDKSINSQTTTAAVPKINIAYYGTSNTALYNYLNSVADFNVTIVTSANLGTSKSSIESYLIANNYDVLFISEEFESTNATTVACEGLNFPVVNGKQFAYKSEVWNWATASNGSSN